MKAQIIEQIKQKGGKVEKREGECYAVSLPVAQADWFYDWRWNVPFQILCHGEGPVSKPRHKQRLEFAIWFNVSTGVVCNHCGKVVGA